jgi:nucleoside-diphosphate-sugar epimerase
VERPKHAHLEEQANHSHMPWALIVFQDWRQAGVYESRTMSETGDRLALVTGATGFTGGALARELLARGWRVRALARNAARTEPLKDLGMELAEGDLTDPQAIDRAVAGCTHVFHIAALYREAKYPDSVYRDVNVGGTRHVLDAADRHGVGRVVHCSTAGVHGDVEHVPADEHAPLRPGDIYQETKLEGEELARGAFSKGLPGSIVRPVGIYGPGDLRFLKLFRTIHTRRFRMFGSGEVFYHLTYIDDLVDGIIRCGEHPAALNEAFILAGPRYTTLNELAALVAEAVGVPPPSGHLPLAPLLAAAWLCEAGCRPLGIDPPLHRRRCDFFRKDRGFTSAKARRLIGYAPKFDLAEGLRRTAEWYFTNRDLMR